MNLEPRLCWIRIVSESDLVAHKLWMRCRAADAHLPANGLPLRGRGNDRRADLDEDEEKIHCIYIVRAHSRASLRFLRCSRCARIRRAQGVGRRGRGGR